MGPAANSSTAPQLHSFHPKGQNQPARWSSRQTGRNSSVSSSRPSPFTDTSEAFLLANAVSVPVGDPLRAQSQSRPLIGDPISRSDSFTEIKPLTVFSCFQAETIPESFSDRYHQERITLSAEQETPLLPQHTDSNYTERQSNKPVASCISSGGGCDLMMTE